MRENAILIISLPKHHHYRRHHHGKGLEASHFSGQRNSIWCSVFVCTVRDTFKTAITAETLLLQATDVDPKANLHNSAQGASWFNLLDCFWKDVTYSHEAWPLALKAGLNDKRWGHKVPRTIFRPLEHWLKNSEYCLTFRRRNYFFNFSTLCI